MSLLIFRLWTATALTFLKKQLKVAQGKNLNMEEVKHKVGLKVVKRIIIFDITSHFN